MSCRCKVVITAVSLPSNSLNYDLFGKICSRHRSRVEQLQINDAELESIDDEIFQNYPNLKSVNLGGNQMKLNFSDKAEGITELDISFNEIVLLRSSTFNSLRFLKVLNMSFNRLEEINDLFVKLHELEELYLNNNRLTIVRYSDFNRLQKLRILNLAHNSLAFFDGQLILPSLQELYLNNNKLVNLRRYDFRNVPSLRVLSLAGNLISLIDETRGRGKFQDPQTTESSSRNNQRGDNSKSPSAGFFFFTIPQNGQNFNNNTPFDFTNQNNKYFNLGHNFLRSNQQKTQNVNSNFNFLQILNESILENQRTLVKNQQNFASYLTGKNYESDQLMVGPQKASKESFLNAWTKLQDLNLAENKITFFPDDFFDNLVELRKLNVSHNELTTFDLMKITRSTKLTLLDIKRNRLNGLNLELFKDKWPVLKVIDLDLNLVNCDESLDILDYFKGSGIVLKGCLSTGCCGRIFGPE
ncbi:hypothetical protein Zmor_024788 [Zophobas morio]|uniref:Uncharacterized protein n=1 Tax=Zophobas morio TaxID=2755281 RepID=A0AA38I334_9CUCU|nr:hypothetical protein Zmor_024788 [Zophobas morio]